VRWEVIAIDWTTTRGSNVVKVFEGPSADRQALDYADALDGLALRCFARAVVELPVLPPELPVDDRAWELGR
jgi:hypothetical protein